MANINAVVVFCGGGEGKFPIFMQEAEKLGGLLAQNNIKLIYGAGGSGLMGAVAKGAIEHGGYVIGATIESLYQREKAELASQVIHKFEVWDKMSQRKVSMTRQMDAACVLPGGLGTLDELFELMVLRQIGIMNKPIVVVNIEGFFDSMYKMLLEMVGMGFIKPHQIKLITFVKTVDEVLPTIRRELDEIDRLGCHEWGEVK